MTYRQTYTDLRALLLLQWRRLLPAVVAALVLLSACGSDDDFTLSTSHRLTFSADTVAFDTLFSNVPSQTRDIWVYNRSGHDLRCTSIRLERGNQTGFRVNVDGTYLGAAVGFQTHDVELRRGDSIRVFIEVTTPMNQAQEPQAVDDNLVFLLESGVEQKLHLNVWSWDAELLRNVRIDRDSTLSSPRPIVIYGGLQVDSLATLTIPAGTTLYFHNDAGIDVYGRLLALGEPDANVVLRGDRLDRMFPYLPYDRISGQWRGVKLHASSYDNVLQYVDLHSAYDGLVVDSSDVTMMKATLTATTIHNCQGHALSVANSRLQLVNCQLSNTLGDCLNMAGGVLDMNACTLAQFYAFDAFRGVAMRFSDSPWPLLTLDCRNTLITGYGDDELMFERTDTTDTATWSFTDCIIRTPEVTTADSVHFVRVSYEQPDDTLGTGRNHFLLIGTQELRYDFGLDSLSTAIGRANPATAPPTDRTGRLRDDEPDIGAYEQSNKVTK